jgi:hypothetical protein
LLAAISLALPYLLGLGCFLLLVGKGLIDESHFGDDIHRLQQVAVVIIFGIELNHLLVLMLFDLKLAMMVGGGAAVAGIACQLTYRFKDFLKVKWAGCGAAVFLLYAASLLICISDPIFGWDARSIWFFHGKMIYYKASVATIENWARPSIAFSHPDYPLLVPILAAQTAFVTGYWNEYLPKLSLAIMLVPAMLFLVSILSTRRWQILLAAVPLLFVREWLTNGYMDGQLALYMGIATFYWGRWLEAHESLDLISALLCTGVVLHLKNEGMLYAVVVLALLAVFAFLSKEVRLSAGFADRLRIALIAMVPVSGVLLWKLYAHIFGLKNDLQLGLSSFSRMAARLADGSFTIILKHLYGPDNVSLSLGIFLLSLVVTVRKGRWPGRGALFSASVALVYFCGIVTIYLTTPYDLIGFHLPTGERTMLPVHIMLLSAAFLLQCGVGRGEARYAPGESI